MPSLTFFSMVLVLWPEAKKVNAVSGWSPSVRCTKDFLGVAHHRIVQHARIVLFRRPDAGDFHQVPFFQSENCGPSGIHIHGDVRIAAFDPVFHQIPVVLRGVFLMPARLAADQVKLVLRLGLRNGNVQGEGINVVVVFPSRLRIVIALFGKFVGKQLESARSGLDGFEGWIVGQGIHLHIRALFDEIL